MGHRSVVSTVHCIAAPFSWMFKVTLCRGSSFGMYQELHKTFPDLVMYDSSRVNSRHCIYGTFDGIYVEQRINSKFLSSLSHGCEIMKIQSGESASSDSTVAKTPSETRRGYLVAISRPSTRICKALCQRNTQRQFLNRT